MRSVFQTAARYEAHAAQRAIDELRKEMAAACDREPATEWAVEWHADFRYYGQVSGYVTIPLESHDPASLLDELTPRFHAGHEREFGYALSRDVADVELVNLRAALLGQMPPIALPARATAHAGPRRAVEPTYFFEHQSFVETEFVDRGSLERDETVEGPAVIEKWYSTTVVPPGARASVVGDGEIVIQLATGRG